MNLKKADSIHEILSICPQNRTIIDNYVIAYSKINSPLYQNIACSISGGSDSDIMLDLCWRCDRSNKIKYIWYDTGMEYQATKDHLSYLEQRYGIQIYRIKAASPVAACCRKNGVPFLSKMVSDYVSRLQAHHFQWEDGTLGELLTKYCTEILPEKAFDGYGNLRKKVAEYEGKYYTGCVSALKWWCSAFGEKSRFNIDRKEHLKEFLQQYPPHGIKISASCCDVAKKKTKEQCLKRMKADLNIYGVRRAEGERRASAYHNCFSIKSEHGKADEYRPVFFYTDRDKAEYEQAFHILHSDCYTKYGLKRTGCAGCPFGNNPDAELQAMKKYEPKLYAAAMYIFGSSYKYAEKYRLYSTKLDHRKGTNAYAENYRRDAVKNS